DFTEQAPNEDFPEDIPQVVVPRWRRWDLFGATLAWVVILLLVTFAVALRHLVREEKEAAEQNQLELLLIRMQARYLVGVKEFTGGLSSEERALFTEQLKALNTGPIEQRLRALVLIGDLAGPTEARQQLRDLKKQLAANNKRPRPEQEAVLTILDRLYHDYARLRFDGPSVTKQERDQLRSELGWFGDLALAPAGLPRAEKVVRVIAGALAAEALPPTDAPDAAARERVM